MNQFVTALVEQAPIEKAPTLKKRWGFWATLGFSLGIILLCLMVNVVLIVGMTAIEDIGNPDADTNAYIKTLVGTGFFIALSTILSAWVCTLGIGAAVLLRKDISIKDYLHLKHPPFKNYALWLGLIPVFVVAFTLVAAIVKPPDSDWMVNSYQSADNLPLFWIAIVIGAPVLEEMFFRGFLFEGLRDSRLGSVGAILITSVLWAAIHMQYQVFGLSVIATLGILLGIAKIKTKSLYIPLAMHAFFNFIAMAQITYFMMQSQPPLS